MEIFTSMTFWIIVVLIVVLLAIIGFVAEGTILGSKKKEVPQAIIKQPVINSNTS